MSALANDATATMNPTKQNIASGTILLETAIANTAKAASATQPQAMRPVTVLGRGQMSAGGSMPNVVR